MEKGLIKFWEWMEKKEYGVTESKRLVERNNKIKIRFIYPTKQMLIGHMIEYLAEKGIFLGMASASAKDIRNDLRSFENIEEYHDKLVNEIKRINRRIK